MGFDSLPSVTTMFEKASAWATPIFNEFQWVIWLSVGIVTVVSAIYFLGDRLENGFLSLFGQGGYLRGGRKRPERNTQAFQNHILDMQKQGFRYVEKGNQSWFESIK